MPNFKEAKHYKKLPNKKVICKLCPHQCIIDNGEVGRCKIRMNILGNLKSMNYGKPYKIGYKKIEELPLYHFMPDSKVLIVGNVGDNLNVPWDENETKGKEINEIPTINQTPIKIIKQAEKTNTKVIVHGDGEPIVAYEQVFDIADNSRRMKHVLATKGFIEELPIRQLAKKMSGALIDIKSVNENMHENIGSKLEPILKAIKILYDNDIWIEIKLEMIPGIHDNFYDLRRLIAWMLNNLNYNIPLHLIAKEGFDKKLIEQARNIALSNGLNFVYTHGTENNYKTTYCPNCKKALIERGYNYSETNVALNLKDGKCSCGKEIAGIWE